MTLDEIIQKPLLTEQQMKDSQQYKTENFSLPKVPGLILCATYLACYNSDKHDALIVGHKHSSRSKKHYQSSDSVPENQLKPATKDRIDFYAQFLSSLAFANSQHHRTETALTLDYNASFRLLEDFRLIKRLSSSAIDEMTSTRFLYTADKNRILNLSKILGIAQIEELMLTTPKYKKESKDDRKNAQ